MSPRLMAPMEYVLDLAVGMSMLGAEMDRPMQPQHSVISKAGMGTFEGAMAGLGDETMLTPFE